jgi:hypothetical protein
MQNETRGAIVGIPRLAGAAAMSEKARYEIHYKLLGVLHTDLIEDLDVRVVDVVRHLGRKHRVAVNDQPTLVPISDVEIHERGVLGEESL